MIHILRLLILLSFIFSPSLAKSKTNEHSILSDSIIVYENTIEDMSIGNHASTQSQNKKTNFFTPILRGGLGMIILIFIAYLLSTNRKAISWRVVGVGLVTQLIFAFSILNIGWVRSFFEFFGKIFIKILDFTKYGSEFLFGDLLNIESFGFIFALQILPTIIFFSALTNVLFYLGVIQKVVYCLAWLLRKSLSISGAESLSIAGNIFLGQTEAPLLIKSYLDKMNKSELFLVMTGGMATVAGGVLAAYILFLGGDDPIQRLVFAKHLLAASVMAAPGAVIISKILIPQTEEIKSNIEVSKQNVGSNFLDAMSNGTSQGLKLALNVGAMLMVFFSFIALLDYLFIKVGSIIGINESVVSFTNGQYASLSLRFILGYILSPFMWLIGVSAQDITLVGQLLGEKIIASEFVGYKSLGLMKEAGAFSSNKSIIMSIYILCGFANFASIGIQIGGIGGLAPSQKVMLSKLGVKALIAGTLASLMSATVIGMLLP